MGTVNLSASEGQESNVFFFCVVLVPKTVPES